MQRRDFRSFAGQSRKRLFVVPPRSASDPDAACLPMVVLPAELRISPQWRDALVATFHQVRHQGSASDVLHALQADLTAVALLPLLPAAATFENESLYAAPIMVRKRVVSIVDDFSSRSSRMMTEAGTGDYATLASSPEEITSRLRLRFMDSLASDIVSSGVSSSNWVTGVQASATLSPKERRLYAHLVRNFGHPVSRAEVLHTIWDRDPNAAAPSNIVDVYIRYLRLKLRELAPHLEIATVRQVGYVLRERGAADEQRVTE